MKSTESEKEFATTTWALSGVNAARTGKSPHETRPTSVKVDVSTNINSSSKLMQIAKRESSGEIDRPEVTV